MGDVPTITIETVKENLERVEDCLKFFEGGLARYEIKMETEVKISSVEILIKFWIDVFKDPVGAARVGEVIARLIGWLRERMLGRSKDKNRDACYAVALHYLATEVKAKFKKLIAENPITDGYEFLIEDTDDRQHSLLIYKNCDRIYPLRG